MTTNSIRLRLSPRRPTSDGFIAGSSFIPSVHADNPTNIDTHSDAVGSIAIDVNPITIQEIRTPALGVKFPSMGMMHKWYVDDEVERA